MLGLPISTVSPVGNKRLSVDTAITSAVRKASLESGSPFELMMASAQMESGMRTSAKAGTSSAAGLFQFTEQTWLDTVKRHGAEHGMAKEASAIVDHDGRLTTADPSMRQRILALRNDLTVASSLAGDHLHDLSTKLSAGLGRAVTAGEVYLGHFLGAHGAKQIISAPQNQIAANVLPDAAKSNTQLFYAADGTPFTTGQFLQHMQKRLKQAFADIGAMTSGATSVASTGRVQNAVMSSGTAPATGRNMIFPARIQSASERQVMAALVEPLLQADQLGVGSQNHHAKLDTSAAVDPLTALRMTTT